MRALLPLVLTLILLIAGGAAWFAALLVTRKARLDLERRVSLVSGAAQTKAPGELARVPLHKSLLAAGARIRRLFTLGAARRWGMHANSVLLFVIAGAAGIAAWLLTHTGLQFSFWISLPATFGAFMLAPRALLNRQQKRTEQQLMVLFPDAIDMIIRMLRAGLPITAATRAVGNEAPAPVNLVFRSIADQVDIGVPFEAALEILADIIRKRRTVRLRAQAATGEVRMSAYILGALPFLVTGTFLVISPGYLTPLATDPRGHVIVGLALLGLTLAYLTMRRMLHSVTMA